MKNIKQYQNGVKRNETKLNPPPPQKKIARDTCSVRRLPLQDPLKTARLTVDCGIHTVQVACVTGYVRRHASMLQRLRLLRGRKPHNHPP